MGVHTLLQRRRYSYVIRKRVPADLVTIIGKREIIKSLGTLNVQEAKTKANLMAVRWSACLPRPGRGYLSPFRMPKSWRKSGRLGPWPRMPRAELLVSLAHLMTSIVRPMGSTI